MFRVVGHWRDIVR